MDAPAFMVDGSMAEEEAVVDVSCCVLLELV